MDILFNYAYLCPFVLSDERVFILSKIINTSFKQSPVRLEKRMEIYTSIPSKDKRDMFHHEKHERVLQNGLP
ncbi:hypothetical protein CJ483_16465 [Bacillus sp. PK3_68]|nr:hypothetical protein CJ483_16465 [Bacillus sp. PK3_68]